MEDGPRYMLLVPADRLCTFNMHTTRGLGRRVCQQRKVKGTKLCAMHYAQDLVYKILWVFNEKLSQSSIPFSASFALNLIREHLKSTFRVGLDISAAQ